MKLICWWLGTDALTLKINPPGNWLWYLKLIFYRLKWSFLKNKFEHWAVHKNLLLFLDYFGIKKVKIVTDSPMYPDVIKKIPHYSFNVLYYRPKPINLGGWKYINWYYGYDIFLKVKEHFKDTDIQFVEIDGSINLRFIYPIIDCYIRPNHFDGMPR